MSEGFSEEAGWSAAQRVEAWAGEIRVNLVRLLAIAAFYGHHLLQRYVFKAEFPPGYHQAATSLVVAWTLAGLCLHAALSRSWNPPWLRYAAAAFDAAMIAALMLISDGPRGPFPLLLYLLIATAALRLDLRLVWTSTLLALLAYGFACGHDRWGRRLPPSARLPRSTQVIAALGLGCAGLLAGQAVRQAKRFARDYADRQKDPV